MTILIRLACVAALLWVAQWWIRGWARYRSDEILMDAAMEARDD
jgi:hypothetical protein